MGTRTADKLKEIEDLRASLESKLGEFEGRFPIAGLGKKAAAVLAGGSAGGTAIAFFMRRFRKRRTKKTSSGGAAPATQPVVVNVVPKSVTLVAAVGIAAWAGVRLYEAMQKSKSRSDDESLEEPVVVRRWFVR